MDVRRESRNVDADEGLLREEKADSKEELKGKKWMKRYGVSIQKLTGAMWPSVSNSEKCWGMIIG
jgi:hypothetical protein